MNNDTYERTQIFECRCNEIVIDVGRWYIYTNLWDNHIAYATYSCDLLEPLVPIGGIVNTPVYFNTYDIFGNYIERVYSLPFYFIGIQDSFSFSVANYPTGTYYLRIESDNIILAITEFIVEPKPCVSEPIINMPLGLTPDGMLIGGERSVRRSDFNALCAGLIPAISIPVTCECDDAKLLFVKLGSARADDDRGIIMQLSNPFVYDAEKGTLNIYLEKMRFPNHITYTNNIQPYPLAPIGSNPAVGSSIIVPYSENGVLYYKEGTVISNAYCASMDSNITSSTLCAYNFGVGQPATLSQFPFITWFVVEVCGEIFTIPYPFFNTNNTCSVGMYKESLNEVSSNNAGFNINTNFANDLLSINIGTETKTTATLNIYTISGKKVETKTFDLSKNSVYNHSTVGYTNGTYIYNITVDDNSLFEGQFVIVR